MPGRPNNPGWQGRGRSDFLERVLYGCWPSSVLTVPSRPPSLAFSGVKNWERNLFNAVLVGQGGPELFQGIYGKRDASLATSAESGPMV